MKARLLVPLFIAALVLALTAITAACGDGEPSPGGNGELTLEEYFQGIEAAFAAANAAGQDVAQPEPVLEDPEATLEEKKTAFKDFFTGYLAVTAGFIDDLEALDPPAEVEDAHNDWLTANRNVLQAGEDIRDNRVDAIQSDAEFQPILDEFFGPQGTQSPLGPACEALQAIADDNHIDVVLNC